MKVTAAKKSDYLYLIGRVIAAAISLSYLIHGSVVWAKDETKPKQLLVVTMPSGSSEEALIARSVVPLSVSGDYQLTHAEERQKEISIQDRMIAEKRHFEETAERAREAALDFNLVESAKLWRRAADELLESEMLPLNPSLVAGYLLEAGAASAEADEEDLALAYFRKTLAVNADLRPGPTISPEVKQLFESARAAGPLRFEIPGEKILRNLCRNFGFDGVLWIAVGRDDGLVVTRKLMLLEDIESEPDTAYHPPHVQPELDRWIEKEQKRIDAAIRFKLTPKKAAPKPWYKKWWFYTLVGGVVAAGVTGLAVGLAQDEKEVDIMVHH